MLTRSGWHGIGKHAQTALALLGMGLVVALVGWEQTEARSLWLLFGVRAVSVGFGLATALEVLSAESPRVYLRGHWLTVALSALVVMTAFFETSLSEALTQWLGGLSLRNWLMVVIALQQCLALAARVGEVVPWVERHLFARMSPGLLLVGTFAFLVLVGALLLKMPKATTHGISWLDALFTSTSAVCVTGLVVVDTATAFTPTGHAVILALIQLGGFGIMTLTFFLAMVAGQGVSVSSRVFLRDLLNTDNLGNLGRLLTAVIGVTLAIELVGALSLAKAWEGQIEEGRLAWMALFHSVSAFCNAGFSLFPNGLAEPEIAANRGSLGIVMVLVILGGIGFPVLRESGHWIWSRLRSLRGAGPRLPRLSVHSRLAMVATAILIVGGAALIMLADRFGEAGTLGDSAWLALFRSVSARTAGFNIADIGAMSQAAAAVVMCLMFVGGCPGGMAGGVKVTTMAAALMNLARILRRRRDVTLFRRRLDDRVNQRAFAIILLSQVWIMLANGAILLIQPDLLFVDTLFETVSAFATVGISRGITAELEPMSKWIIILTMFVGRIGILNFFLSLLPAARERNLRLPLGNVSID